MEARDPILERVASLNPKQLLDVGCGCGSFTVKLSQHCGRIIAIDPSQARIDQSKKENGKPNISYLCMDGRSLKYPDNSFDVVMAREILHHVREWQKVLDEMMRVSAKHVLVEEPIDDPRSEEKRNAIRAQTLYLELQNEVGFSHYTHIPLDSLREYFRKKKVSLETEIIRSDELVDFDSLFSSFGDFAEKSSRKGYWLNRLESLRRELEGKKLCEEDIVFFAARKS
jgi:ubiquinone/menaquinone biosynthesis C-methylase UbiE